MIPVGPGDIRASRRWGVVLTLTLCRLVIGFCLASPLASLVGASGVGLRAEGDRALFEGGGYLLLEVLRLQGPGLSALARGLAPLLVLGLLFTAVSNVALLVALGTEGRLRLRELAAHTAARLPGALVIGAGSSLGQVIVLGVGASVAASLPDPLARPLVSSLGPAAVWLLAATLAGALGGFADTARSSLVRHELPVGQALVNARRLALTRPLQACLGWLPYAVVLIGAVAAVSKLTELCDVARPGAWRVACVFALHQAVVLLSVALRAGWYAATLRLAASAR